MNREIESSPVEAQPARPPVLSAEHPGQRTAVGRDLDAHQSADLVTAPDEACRAAEKQWFPRGRIDGGREGPKNDVSCEMVDGHGLDRTSLGARSHVASDDGVTSLTLKEVSVATARSVSFEPVVVTVGPAK